MARLLGVDLPNKRMEIALCYIYGIGKSRAAKVLDELGIDRHIRANQVGEQEMAKLRELLEKKYSLEGELRNETRNVIKRLVEINCYRGMRHRAGLPVRGQRTRTNAKTRKGKGKTVANKKLVRK